MNEPNITLTQVFRVECSEHGVLIHTAREDIAQMRLDAHLSSHKTEDTRPSLLSLLAGPMLLREAQASVALDHDERAQTYSLE